MQQNRSPEMEKLYTPLDQSKSNLDGRSLNNIRVKEIRQRAVSENTINNLRENPYLEIWDIDYYSTSDEEDNDSGKESEDEGSSADSEDDEGDKNEEEKSKGDDAIANQEETKGDAS